MESSARISQVIGGNSAPIKAFNVEIPSVVSQMSPVGRESSMAGRCGSTSAPITIFMSLITMKILSVAILTLNVRLLFSYQA
jgi:hypothetical protein